MEQYISKAAVVAKIEKRKNENLECAAKAGQGYFNARAMEDLDILSSIDTLEVKEVDLMLHTIIAECCDWLATNTNLSHDEIEGCRNLMLTVKEEQCKAARKGE